MKRTPEAIAEIKKIARQFLDLDALEECQKLCEMMLKENSKDHEFWYLYGVSIAKDGHSDLAKEAFLKSLSLRKSEPALANYIQVILEEGDYKLYLRSLNEFFTTFSPAVKTACLQNVLHALRNRYVFFSELPTSIRNDLDNIHPI